MPRKRIGFAIGMIILLFWTVLARADEMKVILIELHNRTAESIIPLVKQLLSKGGGVSGSGFNLILKTNPRNALEIQQIIATIDTPPKTLLISVRESRSNQNSRRAPSILNQPVQPQVASRLQQSRVLDGDETFIKIDTAALTSTAQTTGALTAVLSDLQWQPLHSGFYITPLLIGKRVQLALNQYSEKFTSHYGSNINSLRMNTVITLPLGQWKRVGAVISTEDGYSMVFCSTRQQQSVYDIEVKVEVVK